MAAGDWLRLEDNGDGTSTFTNNEGYTIIIRIALEHLDETGTLTELGQTVLDTKTVIPPYCEID